MAKKWTIVCEVCGKKSSFMDSKDVAQAHWKIIAWNVATGEPRCTCEKCDYRINTPAKKSK